MQLQNGKWILLNEKQSDYALTGIPRDGEIVRIDFTHDPANGQAVRVGSSLEGVNVFKAKKHGQTRLFSAA